MKPTNNVLGAVIPEDVVVTHSSGNNDQPQHFFIPFETTSGNVYRSTNEYNELQIDTIKHSKYMGDIRSYSVAQKV